jgi:hypothetical protein
MLYASTTVEAQTIAQWLNCRKDCDNRIFSQGKDLSIKCIYNYFIH